MTLLSINIPTFERLQSFSTILLKLESEALKLQKSYLVLLEINVFENCSSVKQEKSVLCSAIASRSGINVNFRIHDSNIGADENIYKCCIANRESEFTWVLGDDDHVTDGCLLNIFNLLLQYRNNLGLLILSDGDYVVDDRLKNKMISSYFILAKLATNVQPHYLIAHTLISCNIFRTAIFDEMESIYVTRDLTKRLGLSANFSHMRGMVKGLLSSSGSNYCILTPEFVALDTTKRLPAAVSFDHDIQKIYYFYFQWLLTEIGTRVDQVRQDNSVDWLFESR